VSFVAITVCVASQRVFTVISLSTQSGNFWIHPRIHSFWISFVSSNLYVALCYGLIYVISA
jgi:hypothetical protein